MLITARALEASHTDLDGEQERWTVTARALCIGTHIITLRNSQCTLSKCVEQNTLSHDGGITQPASGGCGCVPHCRWSSKMEWTRPTKWMTVTSQRAISTSDRHGYERSKSSTLSHLRRPPTATTKSLRVPRDLPLLGMPSTGDSLSSCYTLLPSSIFWPIFSK